MRALTEGPAHSLRQIMAVGLEDVICFGRTVTGFEQDGEQVRVQLDDPCGPASAPAPTARCGKPPP
ncbi:hypothetical protein NW895_37120 [Streptomyces sp. S.PNR 29]|nr:hypothetical protein [Streptomyces sp. S.PNR 29]